MIKQAIIPLAGLGTRLLPLTTVFAKELLPINGKPAIEYIIEECIESGIKEIIFIISNKKFMIKDYFYQNPPRGTLFAQDIMFPNRELKHVIIRGDTLSEIAQYYNVSISAIRSINKMKNNNIRIGQVLKIPSSYGT